MRRGRVREVDAIRRVAKVIIQGGSVLNVDIPIDKTYITEGYLVTVDESPDGNTLGEVMDIPDNDKDPYDPLAKRRKGVARGNTSAHWTPSAIVDPAGGDYYFQPNKAGFISLLRGFAAILGGGPLAQIRLYGTRKLTQLITDNFQILGNKVNVSITQSDDSSQPQVRMEIGSMVLDADTGGTKLTFLYGGIFRAVISPERIGVDVRDPKTQNYTPIYEVCPTGVDNTQRIRQLYSDYVAEAAHYMISAGDTLDLNAKNFNVSATTAALAAALGMSLTAKTMNIQTSEKLSVSAGSETHSIGSMGMPGNWQVNNGLMSSMRMNEAGIIELFSPMGIQLNGSTEAVANASQVVAALTVVYGYLQAVNTLLFALPGGSAVAAPNQQVLNQGLQALSQIPNLTVRMGRPMPLRTL